MELNHNLLYMLILLATIRQNFSLKKNFNPFKFHAIHSIFLKIFKKYVLPMTNLLILLKDLNILRFKYTSIFFFVINPILKELLYLEIIIEIIHYY